MSSVKKEELRGKKWSKAEVQKLKEIVEKYKGKHWKIIAKHFKGRTASQCSQRYRRLKPFRRRQQWTPKEDNLLKELVI